MSLTLSGCFLAPSGCFLTLSGCFALHECNTAIKLCNEIMFDFTYTETVLCILFNEAAGRVEICFRGETRLASCHVVVLTSIVVFQLSYSSYVNHCCCYVNYHTISSATCAWVSYYMSILRYKPVHHTTKVKAGG